MRNTITLVLILVLIISLLPACSCDHEWTSATCEKPKTCTKCGLTEGKPAGHKWVEATCTAPKYCAVCAITIGEPLGHNWKDATCNAPKTCSRCKTTEGAALGHTWIDATCAEPKTCSVCGATDGVALGHRVESWQTIEESTCTTQGTQEGVCTVCGETVTEFLELKEHTPGDWVVTTEATEDSPGIRVKYCTVCETELEREAFTLTPEELRNQYISKCESISYDNLARNPDDYTGKLIKFTNVRVLQVCSEASSAAYYSTYRVATSGRWDNVVYLLIDNYGSGSRILEDDYITIYGEYVGLYTYTTVMGASVTIPKIIVKYYN